MFSSTMGVEINKRGGTNRLVNRKSASDTVASGGCAYLLPPPPFWPAHGAVPTGFHVRQVYQTIVQMPPLGVKPKW